MGLPPRNCSETHSELGLPYNMKPLWADVSDARPGVGESNFEVQFRDAKMAMKSDYRIRVHRSRNDSNEAERTNSAIGEALADGGTINWDKHELFDGLMEPVSEPV